VDRVFLIRHGVVKLLRYLPNGRSRIVRLHTRGDWLGLEALVGFPYEHTAVAVGDVQVDHVSVRNLQRLEWRSPRQFSRVLSQWHSHLVQADKWISDLSTGGIKPRVARLLAFLSDLEYGSSSDLVELLTVHEMADMLGVTQESVSRILAGFKRDAILRKHAGSGRDVYHFDNVRLMQESAM
jgi:CRP/FNR family transcriptional regulator